MPFPNNKAKQCTKTVHRWAVFKPLTQVICQLKALISIKCKYKHINMIPDQF